MGDTLARVEAAVQAGRGARVPVREAVREALERAIARNRGALADLEAEGFGTLTLEATFRGGHLVNAVLTLRLTDKIAS